MENRVTSKPIQSSPMVVDLPIHSTTLKAHQKSHLNGGYVPLSFDIIYDYISQEFGVDLSMPWYDTSNYLM